VSDLIFGATRRLPDLAKLDHDIAVAAEAWIRETGKHSDPRHCDATIWDRLCEAVYRKWEADKRGPER
jgi:hypothetical protein